MKFEQAKNISDAWHNFDPGLTLPMTEERSFFVENPASTPYGVNALHAILLRDKNPKKYFVCGHRGSGKSTMLNKLAHDPKIQNKFTVLSYQLDLYSDFATLNYMDFLISIALNLKELKNQRNRNLLDKKLLKEIDEWFKTITLEMDKKEEYKIDAGIKLSAIVARCKTMLSTQGSWRSHMTVVIEPKLTDLRGILDRANDEIIKKTGNPLLVIIDNIDHADSGKVREIINNSFSSITLPAFHIVYTLPIGLRGDKKTVIPRDLLFVVPQIKILKREETDLTKLEDSAKFFFREYIEKRMELSLIEDAAVNEAILLSGGNFREMGRVLQLAIDFAEANNRSLISLADVEKVRYEIIKSFQPLLRPDDYDLLEVIKRDKEWIDEIDFMLQHLIVLEYENDMLWLNVRQALIPFLEKRKRTNGK